MAVRYETNPRSLSDWMTEIRQHRLVLPRFQRMEAWSSSQVKELLQSVIEGLPIGVVLLLEVSGEPDFACRSLEGAPESGEPIREMILDGQQRLTALWRALSNDYERDEFFLRVSPVEGVDVEDLPIVERVRFYDRNGRKYPLWPSDPQKVYGRGLIPISILNPDLEDVADEWVEVVTGQDLEEYKKLNNIVSSYRESVKIFQIPYIRLAPETEPEAVITTFTKVNTQGTPLSAFDLVVARMEARDIDLHRRSNSLWDDVPALERFERVDDLDILRALVLLENKRPTRSNVLRLDPDHLIDCWDNLKQGVRRAIEFLEDEYIFDGDRIPTESVLPVLFAIWAKIPEGGLQEGNARTLLREYIWRSFFSDRYERAANTAALQDFRALERLLNGEADFMPIREALLPDSATDLLDAGWPRRRDRLARAVLCLTLRGGAKDIYDAKPITDTSIASREYHHLFPRKYLHDEGLDDSTRVDTVLNVALVTRKTNRQISATSPAEYLQRVADRSLDPSDLEDRLRSHLIPVEPFLEADYVSFLEERAQLVFDGMQELVQGRDWHPVG